MRKEKERAIKWGAYTNQGTCGHRRCADGTKTNTDYGGRLCINGRLHKPRWRHQNGEQQDHGTRRAHGAAHGSLLAAHTISCLADATSPSRNGRRRTI
jgi:hypothetical protein